MNEEQFMNRGRLIYFLESAGWSFQLKYNSNYLNSLGMSVIEIGVIQSVCQGMAILVSPIWGMIMDKVQKANEIQSIKYLGMPIFYMILQFILQPCQFVSVLICMMGAMLLWLGCVEITDSLMVAGLKDPNKLGTIKFTSSIGMLSAGVIYGIVASKFGWSYAILIKVILFLYLSLYIYIVKPYSYKTQQKLDIIHEAKLLLRNNKFILIFIINFVFWSFFFIIDNFVWLFLEKEYGVSMAFIGICMIAQKLPEIFINLKVELFINKLGLNGLQVVAYLFLGIRFYLYTLLNQERVYLAIGIEMLHGVSLVFMIIATILQVKKYSPKHLVATGQTITNSFSKMGSVFGGFYSTIIFRTYGGNTLFLFSSIMLFIFTLLIYFYYIYFHNEEQTHQELNQLPLFEMQETA